MRLAIFATHPIQYQVPLFRALARRPGVDLEVLFGHDHGLRPTFDRGFGRAVQYDVPLLDGYAHRFMTNRAPRPGVTITGLLNPEIARAVASGRYDALVLHGYAPLTCQLALFTPRRRARVLLRGDSNAVLRRAALKAAVKHVALRAVFARVDQFLVSGARNRRYYERYGVEGDRMTLAPFSVDNAYFAERSRAARADPAAARLRLGLPVDRPLFVFAGKLIHEKRLHDAIRAIAAANAGRSRGTGAPPAGAAPGAKVALAIVGDGELGDALRAEVARERVEDDVFFLGFRNQSELPEVYGAADAFVLPSGFEQWGLAVNEAMACGLAPIVSDRVGAAADLVANGEGAVFTVGDVRGLADIFVDLARRPERLAAMKLAAAARIRSWGIEETADGFIAGVERALARRA